MIIAVWSPKGGSGTSTIASALALSSARLGFNTCLADLASDLDLVLGVATRFDQGVADWLNTDDLDDKALARLMVEVRPNVQFLPSGSKPVAASDLRIDALQSFLAHNSVTVVDCGTLQNSVAITIASQAHASLMVMRPCYLALHKATTNSFRPSGVVLINESARSLTKRDIEHVLGVDVVADIPYDPAIGRSVDAGVVNASLPRSFERSIRGLISRVSASDLALNSKDNANG